MAQHTITLELARVQALAKMAGKREGDGPLLHVTATEIRTLAEAWLLLDKIDADIARVIDHEEVQRRGLCRKRLRWVPGVLVQYGEDQRPAGTYRCKLPEHHEGDCVPGQRVR